MLSILRLVSILLVLGLSNSAFAQRWVKKVSGYALGNPLAYNPLNPEILYSSVGSNRVLVSRDRGDTWSEFGQPAPTSGLVKSILVSPNDTSMFLIALESARGFNDRIYRSTDGGMIWVETMQGGFSYFGQPLEFDPRHPDTVYTMSNDTLFLSHDFGATWRVIRSTRGLFTTWCDAAVHATDVSLMLVGDNSSGIWKTADGGATWKQVYATLGEIPCVVFDPFNANVAFAAKFGGGGGLVKSTDYGETWNEIHVGPSRPDMWWLAFSVRDSGHLYAGAYGSIDHGVYHSADGGNDWTRFHLTADDTPLNYFNYGLIATDTSSVLTLQSDGLYKLQYPSRPVIHLAGALMISDSRGNADTLLFGASSGATDGQDARYDETAFDPPPANGVFDARWWLSDSVTTKIDVRDTLGPSNIRNTYTGLLQCDSAAPELNLRWSLETSTFARLILRDRATSGSLISIDMHRDTSTALDGREIQAMEIVYCLNVEAEITSDDQWELISLPVHTVERHREDVFPDAAGLFMFDTSYKIPAIITPGVGYWIRGGSWEIDGCAIETDTIEVESGWNLIGAISEPVEIADIRSLPEGLIDSDFFGYAGEYRTAPRLEPGQGYWVKASARGRLILKGRSQSD